MQKKRNVILIAVGTILILAVCLGYNRFVSEKIYEESTSHLQEVYSQVKKNFTSLVSKNWTLLSEWGYYINHAVMAGEEQSMKEYLKSGQDEWGFTEFYFLNEDGNYLTVDGERGVLYLGRQLKDLMVDKKNVVMDGSLPGGNALTVFAAPISKNIYEGFEYSAIAISYNNQDMEQVLDVSAFSDQSDCYVVYPDGRILFADAMRKNQPYNYLSHLQEESDLEEAEMSEIRTNMKKGTEGMTQFRLHDEEYYLSYQPVGFQNWILLGIVPKKVVNASMNQVQWVTVVLLTGLFLTIAGFIFLAIIRRNKINLRDKELELKYREQLFGVLVDSTADIFAMFSPKNYSVEYLSPNIERLLGLSAEAVRQDLSVLTSTLLDAEGELSESELEKIPVGGSYQHERQRIHQKTGKRQWYQETLYRMDIDGREKFVLVMADRTKEREDRERLDIALEIARSANEAKSSFLSNISHDIRTPMNAIVGFAALLDQEMGQPKKVREYARKITASSQHLLSLINDVLDMSKIESGKTTLNIAEFSLGDILENLNTVIRPQASAKKQSFEIQVKGVKQEKFIGDRLRLDQILLNLLSNAVKYTPEGGSILLSICPLPRAARGYVCLHFEVKDSGIGMKEEFLTTIFEPFTRGQNTTVSGIQGTGLGMVITKNLVELMGGNISVKSYPGEGTSFLVDLELKIAGDEDALEFWRKSDIQRMLIVDNEEETCLNIQNLMSKTGVDVQYAVRGRAAADAVRAAQEQKMEYQLILLDWKMPEMDGIETALCIREEMGEDTPILILTAYDWGEAEEEARNAGIDTFLTKPFFESGLRQALTELERENEAEVADFSGQNIFKGKRFLAAEDNKINSELLCELISVEGGVCEVASNGLEALQLFRKSEPGYYDAILMDIQMPVMDGYAAAKAIRTCGHPDAEVIPIAAMTANAFTKDVQDALAAGMNAHIAKPVDMDVLRETLIELEQIWRRKDDNTTML